MIVTNACGTATKKCETVAYQSGAIYTGWTENGKPSGGVGTLLFHPGHCILSLRATWHDGIPRGVAQMRYPDGSYFVGEVDDLTRHGFGLYFGKNWTYEGRWANDALNGRGVALATDGTWKYEGGFKDSRFSGQGSFLVGRVLYEGEFERGEFHGRACMRYANLDVYEGCWALGRKDGVGIYRWTTVGDEYAGTWKDGLPIETGEYRSPDGVVESCVWYPQDKEVEADALQKFVFVCKHLPNNLVSIATAGKRSSAVLLPKPEEYVTPWIDLLRAMRKNKVVQ